MENNVALIITGPPHSGTTILHRAVRSIDGYAGGFECGLMLVDSPKEFFTSKNKFPMYKGGCYPKRWGLSNEFVKNKCFNTNDFGTAYSNLRKHARNFINKELLVDKTPHYYGEKHLKRVISKKGKVPLVIIKKDIRNYYWSLVKKRNSNKVFDNIVKRFYESGYFDLIESLQKKGDLLIIDFEKFCRKDPNEIDRFVKYTKINLTEDNLDQINSNKINSFKTSDNPLNKKELKALRAKFKDKRFYTE